MSRKLMGTTALRKWRSICSLWLTLSILLIDGFLLFEAGFWQAEEAFAQAESPAIKIESFDQDIAGDGSTFTLAHDVGDTSAAFIRMSGGTRKSSAGPVGSTGNAAPNVGTVGLVLSSTNEVTAERVSATPVKVMGEVWRYEGVSGGGNEFITRDRVAVTLSGSSASVSVPGIVDVDKVVPFLTGYTVDDTSVGSWNAATIAVHMTDSGELQVSRNNSGTAATVYVDVVEFTGENWTVCHGVSNGHDTSEQTISLNTSSDGDGGSSCDVSDWNTATIIQATMEGDSAETGLSDTLALVRPGGDTASVTFDLQQDGNARNDGQAWIQVLQNDDLIVNRDSNTNLAEGNNTYGTIAYPSGVNSDTPADELALEWFTDTSGVGTAHMRGGLHARITDTSVTYADGDTVFAAEYDSTQIGTFSTVLTFAASPSGVVYEAGGTGTGAFVGYNSSGDFVIRAGNGASVAPADAARIVIPSAEYDFSNRTGTLTWEFNPDTDAVQLAFDEGSDSTIEYSTSTTASADWSNWSGGDDGGVGTSNGNVAGSELASGFDFNGSIASLYFTQGGELIEHWIHRSGNTVGVEYGVIDLSNLESVTSPTFATVAGSQIATTSVSTANVFWGQRFAVTELSTTQNVTNLVLTESGTIDASLGLNNVRLFYELDTTAPYDCVDESFSGAELQFGATTTFSGADGTVVFSDSVSISPTAAFCAYAVSDVTSSAENAQTINFSIDNPQTDITVTGGGLVSGNTLGANSETVVVDAELTQTHYHWRDDDGTEASASSATGGVQDTPALAFSALTTQRLRIGIAVTGSSDVDGRFRLEYAEKVSTCEEATGWIDVGGGGGAWDMSDSLLLIEGNDTTNIAEATGGISDDGYIFLTPNGGVRDASSQTDSVTVDLGELIEVEYSIEATATAIEGLGYCFRVTDEGIPLRNYNTYPEATLSAEVTVSAVGSHIASVSAGATDVYIGGQFVAVSNSGSHTITELTVTETGSIDAALYLSNPRIYYESDTTNPRDCASVSYDGAESFSNGTSFVSENGTTTFSISSPVQTGETFCAYIVVDVSDSVPDGESISFEITNPNADAVIAGATIGPGSAVAPSGSVTVEASSLTQANYHWRNDDGSESGATSATFGSENSVLENIFQGTTKRVRIAVANDGSISSSGSNLRLEYGTKVTTCANVGVWQRVDGGAAFGMATTSNLVDGSDTTNIAEAVGGVSDPAASFLSPNAGQLDQVDQAGSLSISTTEFVELEYAVQVTTSAGFGTTYCFRLTDAGEPLDMYTNYPELTVQERQDFYVQHGTETVSGTGVTLTAGVDYVAPASNSSAFVRITNTSMTGAGSDTLGATRNPDQITAYITGPVDLASGFTIARPGTATDNTRVSWEIVEYIGVAGGDNEFIVRAADEVTYGTSDLFATGTAAVGVADDTDVVVFITGQLNPATAGANFNAGLSVSHWSAATDQPLFERGDADGESASVSYAVVEFTGASWKVQRASHTYTAAGVVETEAIAAVNGLNRTFLHTQKLSGDELFNLDETGHEVWLSSIGAVSFQLQSGSTNPSDQRSVAWVIENTQLGAGSMAVYRTGDYIPQTATQPTSYLYPIGTTLVTANASIFANLRSTGAGSAHPRAIMGARVFDETQFELWKSDEGQNQTFRVEVVDWPVAETSLRQTNYRLYVNDGTLTPTDPWPVGVADLGENTAMTDLDEPMGQGEQVRLRIGLFVNNASLVSESANFKLQYARRVTSCAAASTWADVGDAGSGEVWRAADGTPVDGSALVSGLLSTTDQLGTYEENNPSAFNPSSVSIGEYIEYDWLLEHNGAIQKSSYCFKLVYSNGAELSGYDVYPTVRTTGYTPVVSNWRWYDDETNVTPDIPLAAEQVTPIELAASNTVKLRVALTEIEGAPGEDIKFNLQYSQWSDFRDGGTTLTATTSCDGVTRTWCYQDGAGVDNATLSSSTLSGGHSCQSGVGTGCGTVNEASGLVGTYDQAVFTTSEHEFTLLHNSVGYDQVYYFRLYDATNGTPVLASVENPSITTAGAALTFTVSGLDANQVFEGVTLDATTTATSIDFGTLPFGTSVEAGQRLTVYTNGTEGYRVYLDAGQQLTNTYGDEIQPITSTNESPTPWSTACAGGAVSCFGYHVGDNILYDGSLRFALDDSYAALGALPVEVMASGMPVTFDTSEVIYRTQVSEAQPAGEYMTTLRYIVVPVF